MKLVIVNTCMLVLLCLIIAPLANAQSFPNIPSKAGEQMLNSDGNPIEKIEYAEFEMITHNKPRSFQIARKWRLVSTEAAHDEYFPLESPNEKGSKDFPVWGEQIVYEWITRDLPPIDPLEKNMKMATNGVMEEQKVVRKPRRNIYEVKVTPGSEERYEKGNYVPR